MPMKMIPTKMHRSGVTHPIPEDSAGVGETRDPLLYKPLPRQEHPFRANSAPSNNGPDKNQLTYPKSEKDLMIQTGKKTPKTEKEK